MSVLIVVALEVVDIAKHDRQRRLAAAGAQNLLLQARLKSFMAVELCERIMRGLDMDLLERIGCSQGLSRPASTAYRRP